MAVAEAKGLAPRGRESQVHRFRHELFCRSVDLSNSILETILYKNEAGRTDSNCNWKIQISLPGKKTVPVISRTASAGQCSDCSPTIDDSDAQVARVADVEISYRVECYS
jgi:hypothetical protein